MIGPISRKTTTRSVGGGGATNKLPFVSSSRLLISVMCYCCWVWETANATYVDDPNHFKIGPLFESLARAMRRDQNNLIERVRGIYCFKVFNQNGEYGKWIVNAKHGRGYVAYRGTENADVTLTMKDDDAYAVVSGEISPHTALFLGKIKVEGSMLMALKLPILHFTMKNKIEKHVNKN